MTSLISISCKSIHPNQVDFAHILHHAHQLGSSHHVIITRHREEEKGRRRLTAIVVARDAATVLRPFSSCSWSVSSSLLPHGQCMAVGALLFFHEASGPSPFPHDRQIPKGNLMVI